MKPIAVFYHCLFYLNDRLLERSCAVVAEQMKQFRECGLWSKASRFMVGVNGGPESIEMVNQFIPPRTAVQYHGLQCHTENRTILMMEKWVKDNPGWYVLYFHTKGATHPENHYSNPWRRCMMRNAVQNWRQCIKDLDSGCDAIGSHWMVPPATPLGQHIFAGNFFWATSDFMQSLPSIEIRDQIKMTGLDGIESRYESEVWLGNGPRIPKIKDYHGPNWNPGRVHECH